MDALISKMWGRERPVERPPGPGVVENLELQAEFIRDQAGMLRELVDAYGPVTYLRLGWLETYVLLDSDLIEEVLLEKWDSFHKDAVTRDLKELLGEGLLTSEGDDWRRDRKLMAPSLQRRQIASYGEVMVDETERMLDRWSDGDVRRFDRDVMEITLRVVVQTLFDLDLDARIDRVAEAVDDAMTYADEISHSPWRFVPEMIPTPHRAAYEEAIEEFDSIVYELIEARRERGDEGDDLLYHLIEATDDEGNRMSDERLRDQVVTMFLAGHETTALGITYAWYLLAQHPERAERFYEEVDQVLGGERPTAADARELPYVDAVFREALRLYPPAWIIGREAIAEVEIGDWTIPEGAQVLMPQCVAHRNPEWFDEPEAFRPERWLGDLEDELPRFAYFPFGGGPRICIGNHFAKMEAVLIMATMAQRFELESVAPATLETETAITQRPADPVEMRLRSRA